MQPAIVDLDAPDDGQPGEERSTGERGVRDGR